MSINGRVDVAMLGLSLAATEEVRGIPDWNDPTGGAITDQKLWDSMQALNGGHFFVNNVEQTPETVIDVPSTLGEFSGTGARVAQAKFFNEGGGSAGLSVCRRSAPTAFQISL
jgi:hypothetical protein